MQKLLLIALFGLAANSVFGTVLRSRRYTPCADQWTYFEQNCYRIVNRTLASSAHETCAKLGGKLASIHNERENKFIVDTGNLIFGTNFNYIIGFKGLSNSKPYTVSWSDETTSTFTNKIEEVKESWVPSECYKLIGEGLLKYQWNTIACTHMGMAVCKTDGSIVTPSRCEAGWTYFEKSNSCFKPVIRAVLQTRPRPLSNSHKIDRKPLQTEPIVKIQLLNFKFLDKTKASAAPQACEAVGSKLASILSEEENNCVVAEANKFPGTNYHYLIGFKKLSNAKPHSTEWIDGTTGDFTNGLEHFKEKLSNNGCYKICGEGKNVFPWNEIDCSHYGLPICKKLAHKSG